MDGETLESLDYEIYLNRSCGICKFHTQCTGCSFQTEDENEA